MKVPLLLIKVSDSAASEFHLLRKKSLKYKQNIFQYMHHPFTLTTVAVCLIAINNHYKFKFEKTACYYKANLKPTQSDLMQKHPLSLSNLMYIYARKICILEGYTQTCIINATWYMVKQVLALG